MVKICSTAVACYTQSAVEKDWALHHCCIVLETFLIFHNCLIHGAASEHTASLNKSL